MSVEARAIIEQALRLSAEERADIADTVQRSLDEGSARLAVIRAPVEDVLNDALALGEAERSRVIVSLVESLDGEPDADAEQLWAKEIERRLARIDAGEEEFIPMEEALARIDRAARRR